MDEFYVWNKWEFIYKLEGKYYLLGMHACEECKDQKIIDLYNDFIDIGNCKEFIECDSYQDIRSISSWNVNTIGEAYQRVFEACRKDWTDITDAMKSLKDRLEERYHAEIEKQVKRMLIARECYGIKQLKEEERKSRIRNN